MAVLKVADNAALVETPDAAFPGDVEITVGFTGVTVAAVVNVHI